MPQKNNDLRGSRGLADINHLPIRTNISCYCRKPATLTLEAGDKNDVETQGVTVDTVIDGRFYSASALADENVTIFRSEDDSTLQAADTTCYYVFTIDTSDNVRAYKQADDIAEYPAIPESGEAPFAVLKVVTVGVTFTLGTTDYDASGVTSTFTDVRNVPAAVV